MVAEIAYKANSIIYEDHLSAMLSLWDLAIFSVTVFIVFYLWCRVNHSYWNRKKVYSPKSNWLLGNIAELATHRKNVGTQFGDLYFQYKDKPYIGIYMVQRATLLVNDLDLIKDMLVKNFTHFTDHIIQQNEKGDPLGQHLFNLTGEAWKDLRVRLTPAFTSSKMKNMFDLVLNCTYQMENYLQSEVEKGHFLDFKDVYSTLNTDIIGSCAFGIECNCFKDPKNIFKKMGKSATSSEGIKGLLAFLIFVPGLLKRLNFSFFGNDVTDFFHNLIKDTMEYRRKNNVLRNDFVQLLIQLKDDELKNGVVDEKKMTSLQLAAQAFVFYIAGFETSSAGASFAMYEMAKNQEVQEAAREEMKAVIENHGGKITYEGLTEMTYLQQIIDETLRLYPPVPVLFRMCTKNYQLPDSDLIIEKDTPVVIPVHGIHRDPKYFPNPETFDPSRFSLDNKASMNQFAYLPFGEGPRFCIGNRFAMMQMKLGLISVIMNFKVTTCEKTLLPMVLDNSLFTPTSKGGNWLKLTKIDKNNKL